MKANKTVKKLSKLFLAMVNTKEIRFLLLGLILIITFLSAKRTFLYVLFTIFTGIIIYYSKLYHFPIDVSPLFFLEVVIARYYGLQYTLLFILLGYIIPKTFAGSSMNWESYVFIGIGLVPVTISIFFKQVPLVYVGYASSVIQYIGGVMFQSTLKPIVLCLSDGIANITNNILWFLIFSEIVVWLLG